MTTLLLVNNDEARHIKGSRPEGLLTSTARTFVHDGTTTEYGTQIIGTSLDHGRFYAQLLQTSSRVYFGDQERAPVAKAKPDERVTHKSRYFPLNFDNYINPTVFYDIRPSETILVYPTKADDSLNLVKPDKNSESSVVSQTSKLENGVEILVKENSGNIYYSDRVREKERQAVEEVMRMQKALGSGLLINHTRAFANDLPTYTVRHDFAPSGFSWTIPEEKEEVSVKVEKKFRSGKGLHGKAAERKLDTVTYLGFADFTTTVGDTVIVFMPNTRDGPAKTSTAEPEQATTKAEEPKVMTTVKTFFSHSPGMVTRTIPGHNLSMQTSIPTQVAERQSKGMGENIDVMSSFLSKEQDNFESAASAAGSSPTIEPSETLPSFLKTSHEPTDPLATFATTVTKTFGTGGSDKALGLLKSIGGTKAYNGTTTHFTSLLYGTYVGDSYTQILKTTSSVFYRPETNKGIAPTKVLTVSDTSAIQDTATTEEPSKEDHLTTLNEERETTKQIVDTTPEPDNEDDEESVTSTEEYITRIVPSTVYKTFTYLTTFFIPAADGTTTSIRSREVVSSELSYITKVIETDLKHTKIDFNEIKSTEVNLIDTSIDPDFLPPATRILAPEEPITTTTEESVTEETVDLTTEEASTEEGGEVTSKEEVTDTTTKAPITVSVPATTESNKVEEEKEMHVMKPEESTKPTETKKEERGPSTEDDEEEIEVIFKTIYTTYTYLTTFFQESTTSISSREVVVTNVITSTLEITPTPSARELAIEPTSTTADEIQTTAHIEQEENQEESEPTIEPSTTTSEDVEEATTETPELKINGIKTLFTTYTYFTTLFDKGDTSVISRTEVVTNVVNPTVSALPESILRDEKLLKSKFEMLLREQQSLRLQSSSAPSTSDIRTTPTSEDAPSSTITPSTLGSRGKYGTLIRKSKILVSTPILASANELDNSVGRFRLKGDKYDRTVVRKRIRTKSRLLPKSTTIEDGVTTIRLDPTPIDEDDRVILQTMITDVTKTTSGGNRQVKRIAPPEPIERPLVQLEDQISSESNTEDIEPSPTLLLQTSFTTFTYFTTVYKGTTSDVISRLETITNVVTETIQPDILATPVLSVEDATLPITYFTTFTYWTTLYRDGSTVITSREETVSNIVTPAIVDTVLYPLPKAESTTMAIQPTIIPTETKSETPSVQTVFVPAFVPAAVPETTTEKEEEVTTPITQKPINEATEEVINKAGIEEKDEPTTFYTTYTYFTTSYIGDSTVVKSRLETVTNIITATPTISEITANDLQTGRAVNSASANQIPEDGKGSETATSDLQTGLLSTIVSTSVNDGVTTLYSTDVFGTFIDGLYAKVLESTTKIATELDIMPAKSQAEQKTGIVSINEGRIVDADGISTTFFTTKAIGTSIEQLYAQVVESTSSVVIDQDKKSALALLNGGEENNDIFRTGLVRLIEGSIVQDGTVTLYESRVIGTLIDGRYAQIIESTSSFKIEPTISPSVVLSADVTPTIHPSSSPPTIESSIADEAREEDDEDEGEEDEEYVDSKGRVKSRLTFQSRKRTFTPVIRPFASRNRPTFLPKKKTIGASSAQTITRAFTPTVTATLATKAEGVLGSSRNRFGSGRRSSTNQVEVRPTVSTSGRRFSGRSRTSVSSPTLSSTYSPSRGRQSSVRVTATPTINLSSSRSRAFRVSSSRPVLTVENRSNLSLRPRIRPTLSGFPGSRSTATSPPQDEANDLTTVVTEDDSAVTLEDESTSTTTTTTEDPNLARRNNNPLLRFRRPPLIPKATTTTTPKTTTTQAPRRGILSGRNNRPTTTPRPVRTRPSNSFANRSQLQNRPRPVNSLFPPRGLFKKPAQQEEKEEEEIEEEEEEELETEEGEDNNFEETSAKEVETEAEEKVFEVPSGRSFPPVQIRPFRFQRTRTKRQTYEYGARNRQYTESKYRRKGRPQIQERSDYYIDEETTEAPRITSRTGRTYTGRTRTTTQSPVASPPRIRPTLASSQKPQFTLREKETTNPRTSNFRSRSQTTTRRKSTIQKPTEPTLPRKPSRSRTSTTNQDLSRTPQRRNYSNRRTSSTTRGRSRFGDIEDTYIYQQPAFDGTITVTHKIPSEVSIPFVNGKSTEYKNVITAKPSLEIVGPHQYTISTINGGSVIFLNREVTETLNNGLTEVTRFLIHETPTTSITFTPTTIRGRKTSFSHIIPSTVYDVENVVTTLQPQISANAPLANILLSQLLLGNLNLPPNQGIGLSPQNTPTTPTTEYKTRTTTYVTSVTSLDSTVLPITFRGKEILTTVVDTFVNVITATEYITDTIVVTPTLNPNNQINSLLLPALLQAQLLQPTATQIQTAPNPFPFPDTLNLDVLQPEEPKISKNDIRGERDSDEISEEEKPEIRAKSRKKSDKKQLQPEPAKEVITLYVSGRRPGEFSTILSTVYSSDAPAAVRKRETALDDIERLLVEASEVKHVRVLASALPETRRESSYLDYLVTPGISAPVETNEFNFETQSLESVLGDVSKHVIQSPSSSRETVEPTRKVTEH